MKDLGEILETAINAEKSRLRLIAELREANRAAAIRNLYEKLGELYVAENEEADAMAFATLSEALPQQFGWYSSGLG